MGKTARPGLSSPSQLPSQLSQSLSQSENPDHGKKPHEKALILLPPTGSASFFCANRREMQRGLRTRPAAGPGLVVAIARCERFCKGVQWPLQKVSRMCPGTRALYGEYGTRRPVKPELIKVFPMDAGLFWGLIILWSTVQVRVGPPPSKPRTGAAFLCLSIPLHRLLSGKPPP